MTIQQLGSLGEFIAAIATLATLVYLAVQIRRNTAVARATMIHQTNSDGMREFELVAQNADLAAIYDKGMRGESLTGTDLVRYIAIVEMYLIWLENVDSQSRAGLYFQGDDLNDIVDKLSGEIRELFSTPEVRQWWHQRAERNYMDSFAKKINKHIDAD
jgi:hypothetical protein